MPGVPFSGLLVVAVVALIAPVLLGVARARLLPSVVLEILLGIVIGPSGLRWVRIDAPIQVLSVLGLAFLLFLSGLEVELDRLRGRLITVVGLGFALSFGLALVVGYGTWLGGLVRAPLFVAILLVATSLGVIVPPLKDAGQDTSDFGQLVLAAASIADFGSILLLSLFFSREATSTATKLVLLGSFALAALAVAGVVLRVERSRRLSRLLVQLQDTTAQVRIRAAWVLLVAFVVLAQLLGLEVILGAFTAGVILRLVDQDRLMTHPQFRQKLEAVGFGVFIPVFFVASGVQFDLAALLSGPATIARVPIFLAALLLVRGAPALLYRPLIGNRNTVVAALLQATSLPFIVAGTQIGLQLGVIGRAVGAALVSAGLLSVICFPLMALVLLRRGEAPSPGANAGR